MNEHESVLAWIATEGRAIASPTGFLEALAGRLNEAGAAVTRMTTGIPLLHPLIYSSSCVWETGTPEIERLFREMPAGTSDYDQSPIRPVYEGRGPVRRKLTGPEARLDFPILEGFKSRGFTEYLVLPAPFSDGSTKAVSFATDRNGGFSDEAIALFETIMPTLAMTLEIQTLRRTSQTLLDTYLGRKSGRRVLDGHIRRGDGEDITAIIWFCDLRGSTPLADALSRREFLDLLNRFLECMAGAVQAHGGEVLRFIGDAALAIFAIDDDTDGATERACAEAIAAAREAIARISALNNEARVYGTPLLDFGIGLHLGTVMYGNIGAPDRLEFTVIGAAANEAARIEALSKTFGVNFVVSERVARCHPHAWHSLGYHELRGVAEPIEVFTFAEP